MIRTRQLQYAYPGGAALTFPDVDVPQGTVLLLSGPSGCGKSTLRLSPREQRVAFLFASGLTYKQISKQLALSPATVRTYLRNAYIRLGVSNKTQLNKFLVSGTSN